MTGAMTAALIAPVVVDRDGYPLSTYPMYARARPATVVLATAQGIDADGDRQRLSAGEIGDSDDPLIIAGELRQAISDGRADERCAEIAARVDDRRSSSEASAAVTTIEIVTERHDVIARARGDDGLLEREVHASCEVGG